MADPGKLWKRTLGDALSPGDVIAGKYRLDRVLGAGGMGVVLEAHHVELDARVAVKLLRLDQDTDAAQARFLREARAAFKITSEHVARILDLGTHEEAGLYMVMEFLDGRDLSQMMVRHGRLPVGAAVGYILQVCEAVAEAHSLGIVHRDLKPENIFVCTRADGSPCAKVIDFGLAKVEDRVQSLTGMNRGLGTPRYMSPEQWVSARDVGGAADIWALGVILFELVTGKTPFPDDDINELCQAIIAGPVPRASEAEPTLPKGIDDIISKCLQKKPSHRYPGAAELGAALLPFAQMTNVGGSSPTIRPPTPSARWMMSNADLRDTDVTKETLPPAVHTDDATTVDNVAVGHAFERMREDAAPLHSPDSSAEWVAAPLATAQPRTRTPWIIGGGVVAGLAAASLLAASMSHDANAPATDMGTEAVTVSETPATTTLAPLEPVPLAPPPAPLASTPAQDVPDPAPTPDPPPGEDLTEPKSPTGHADAPAPEPEASVEEPKPKPPPPRWRPPIRRRKKNEWRLPSEL